MKKVLLITFVLLTAISTFAQKTATITVTFEGMKSNSGSLFVALYNTEKSFLKEPYKKMIVKIDNLKATAVFKDVPHGEYAISSFHDKNDNKKMDTGMFGVPKEAIGTSNNATGFMGPPKFKDAKFNVTKNTLINIKVAKLF